MLMPPIQGQPQPPAKSLLQSGETLLFVLLANKVENGKNMLASLWHQQAVSVQPAASQLYLLLGNESVEQLAKIIEPVQP
jgi:hypothetical protein